MMNEGVIEKRMPRRRKKIIVVVVVICIVAFSAVWIASIPTFRAMFEAKEVFNAYNQAIVAKDHAMAYNLLAPETKANVSYDKFVGIEEKLDERVGRLRSFNTSEMDTKGDDDNLVTTIQANLTFEKGTLQFEYVLKKEHGIWFVYQFNEL
jgi:hypothetical protein